VASRLFVFHILFILLSNARMVCLTTTLTGYFVLFGKTNLILFKLYLWPDSQSPFPGFTLSQNRLLLNSSSGIHSNALLFLLLLVIPRRPYFGTSKCQNEDQIYVKAVADLKNISLYSMQFLRLKTLATS
jgi:hypothetical protein